MPNANNNCWKDRRKIKVVSFRYGYILPFNKSPWCLELRVCDNVQMNGWSHGIPRTHSRNGLSAFENMHLLNDAVSKLFCIQRNSYISISSKLFFENGKSLYIGNKVVVHGLCQSNIIAGYKFEAEVGFKCKEWAAECT